MSKLFILLLQRIETLAPTIMNTLLDMSNNMLLWLQGKKTRLIAIDDVRRRKKGLKRLKQAEVFLNFIHNRLKTKYFQFGIPDSSTERPAKGNKNQSDLNKL